MEDLMEEALSFRTSRRSFILNYIIGFGLLLYLLFSDAIILLPPFINFIFIFLISIFFLEPEGTIFYSNYFLKEENILEVRGILSKKKIAIPYKSITNILVDKSVLGRIFNFGNIQVSTMSSEDKSIILKGIKHPEKILSLIENFIESKN
jgi:uncharacterized membrane protein YdbT with pleckstrin-like domain